MEICKHYINIIHKEIHSILKYGTNIILTLLFEGMSAFSKIISVGGGGEA
jgi:hypothetical protein